MPMLSLAGLVLLVVAACSSAPGPTANPTELLAIPPPARDLSSAMASDDEVSNWQVSVEESGGKIRYSGETGLCERALDLASSTGSDLALGAEPRVDARSVLRTYSSDSFGEIRVFATRNSDLLPSLQSLVESCAGSIIAAGRVGSTLRAVSIQRMEPIAVGSDAIAFSVRLTYTDTVNRVVWQAWSKGDITVLVGVFPGLDSSGEPGSLQAAQLKRLILLVNERF